MHSDADSGGYLSPALREQQLGGAMTGPRFDVFQFNPNGSVLQLESCGSLQAVKQGASLLPLEDCCKLCVLDRITGEITFYGRDELQNGNPSTMFLQTATVDK
jgi:hypothetical protein